MFSTYYFQDIKSVQLEDAILHNEEMDVSDEEDTNQKKKRREDSPATVSMCDSDALKVFYCFNNSTLESPCTHYLYNSPLTDWLTDSFTDQAKDWAQGNKT